MLEKFHKLSKKRLINQVKKFIDREVFALHPEWKDRISIIITGSTAIGYHDKYSDIDIEILVRSSRELPTIRKFVKTWKKSLVRTREPVHLHRPKTYRQITARIESWEHDQAIREYGAALIVHDAHGRFAAIQQQYAEYPSDILSEKLEWIFAQLIYEYVERYGLSLKRGDRYMADVVKLRMVKLLMNAVLLAEGDYVAYDKHLMASVVSLPSPPKTMLKAIRTILKEGNPKKNDHHLQKVIKMLERRLIRERLLPKQSEQKWLAHRGGMRVEL